MKIVFDALRSAFSKPISPAPALRELDATARRLVSGAGEEQKPLPRTKW